MPWSDRLHLLHKFLLSGVGAWMIQKKNLGSGRFWRQKLTRVEGSGRSYTFDHDVDMDECGLIKLTKDVLLRVNHVLNL